MPRRWAGLFVAAGLFMSAHGRAMEVVRPPDEGPYGTLMECLAIGLDIKAWIGRELGKPLALRSFPHAPDIDETYDMDPDWNRLVRLLGNSMLRPHDGQTGLGHFLHRLEFATELEAHFASDLVGDLRGWRATCVPVIAQCSASPEAEQRCRGP